MTENVVAGIMNHAMTAELTDVKAVNVVVAIKVGAEACVGVSIRYADNKVSFSSEKAAGKGLA